MLAQEASVAFGPRRSPRACELEAQGAFLSWHLVHQPCLGPRKVSLNMYARIRNSITLPPSASPSASPLRHSLSTTGVARISEDLRKQLEKSQIKLQAQTGTTKANASSGTDTHRSNDGVQGQRFLVIIDSYKSPVDEPYAYKHTWSSQVEVALKFHGS